MYDELWTGGKCMYKLEPVLADGGELLVIAPGLKRFGEQPDVDALIRKYGYRGTPATLAAVKANAELKNNLSAAAHLIHGSSEGRFNITYCPGQLTRQEIEGAGFRYADLQEMTRRYDSARLKDGWNTLDDGGQIFYISNPALGLWAHRGRFEG